MLSRLSLSCTFDWKRSRLLMQVHIPYPGAASLNLGLNLDAQGNSNAVFIFKTPTAVAYAFTANPNSKIHLINGAKACNVFWLVSGAVNMGVGVTMRGTIISGGAISMGAQDTLGRKSAYN